MPQPLTSFIIRTKIQNGRTSHKEYLEDASCSKIIRAGKDYKFGEDISNTSNLRDYS